MTLSDRRLAMASRLSLMAIVLSLAVPAGASAAWWYWGVEVNRRWVLVAFGMLFGAGNLGYLLARNIKLNREASKN
jgi:predicted Na+-dependent transporter